MITGRTSRKKYTTRKEVKVKKQNVKEKENYQICANTKEKIGVIIFSNGEMKKGSLKLKKDKYYYFQYREGKKVIQKYLGIL